MRNSQILQMYNLNRDNELLPVFAAAAELHSHVSRNFKGAANDAALSIVYEGLRVRLETTLGKGIDEDVLDSLVELIRFIR